MPLSKQRETGVQEEPQGPPASEPREAVTQPQAPGRHSPDLPLQLEPAVKQLVYIMSLLGQSESQPLSSKFPISRNLLKRDLPKHSCDACEISISLKCCLLFFKVKLKFESSSSLFVLGKKPNTTAIVNIFPFFKRQYFQKGIKKTILDILPMTD